MGNSAGIPVFALSNFDNEVWGKLNAVFCGSTAVAESISKNPFKIAPNPANGSLEIQFENAITSNKILQVFDLSGREILSLKINSDKLLLDTQHLKNGFYFIKCENEFQKFSIVH